MSPREKKLLIFFGTAGFLVINFLAFGFFKTKSVEFERARDQAVLKLETAEMFSASRDRVLGEMDWLAENEPEPAANQDVQTALQQLGEKQAKTAGLTIKSQRPMPSDTTPGLHFHRARIQFTVTGSEQALYSWFNSLNMPTELRVASNIKISPNKEDDTQVDCVAVVEQWFVPIPPSA
jgi:hypothetical protein